MSEKVTLNRLKEQERETRKNLIMDAAERVFSIKTFDKVSMREIAEEAGIGTSSIYTYFPTQESLFVETALRDTNVLIDKLREITEKHKTSSISDAINFFIEYISKHDSYFRMMVVFMTHGNLNEDSLNKLNSVMRKALELFDTLFREAGYTGEIRMLSHLFLATINGITVTYRKLPGRDEEKVIEHMKNVGKVFERLVYSD